MPVGSSSMVCQAKIVLVTLSDGFPVVGIAATMAAKNQSKGKVAGWRPRVASRRAAALHLGLLALEPQVRDFPRYFVDTINHDLIG